MKDVLEFLKGHDLFVGFTDEQVKQILPFIKRLQFEEGEWIFREGEEHREICIFLRGKAESLTCDENRYHRVEVLEAGDWIDAAEKRITSIRALEATEMFLLSMERIRPLLEKSGLYSRFIANFSREVCHLLRENYEKLLQSLKERTKILRWHDQISKLIVHLFVLLGIYFYLFNVFRSYLEGIISSDVLTPFVIIGVAISAGLLIKGSGDSLRFYGVTLENGWRDALEAVGWSIPIMGLMVLIKWVLIQKIEAFGRLPLFEVAIERLWEKRSSIGGLTLVGLYFLLVPVQEFLTRGFLQTVFRNFFRGSSRVILAILVSNVLFEIFHTVRGVVLSLGAFTLGLFWGCLYEKQRSIIGVSVSHALIALWGFGFLGLSQILKS